MISRGKNTVLGEYPECFAPRGMTWEDIKLVTSWEKLALAFPIKESSKERLIAATGYPWPRTYSTANSRLTLPILYGVRTSRICGPTRVGFISPSLLTCILVKPLDGRWLQYDCISDDRGFGYGLFSTAPRERDHSPFRSGKPIRVEWISKPNKSIWHDL